MPHVHDFLLALADKKFHDERPGENQHDCRENTEPHRHITALFHALGDAVVFLCAVVLCGIGRHGEAKGHHGHQGDGVDLLRRRIGRNGCRAEVIERHLQDYRANSDNRGLKAHRQAQFQMRLQHRPAHLPVLAIRAEHRHLFTNVNVANHIAQKLRRNGRERRTGNAPAQDENRNRLQDDVDDERRCQNHRRHTAVAERPQEVGLRLQADEHHNAAEHNADEGVRPLQNLRRRLHPNQELTAERNAHDGQHHGLQKGKHGTSSRALPHASVILGAVPLTRINGNPRGKANHKAEHQKHQAAGTAHRRQRLYAQEAPHNQGVHESVKLLKDVARNQRQRKHQNQPCGAAFR